MLRKLRTLRALNGKTLTLFMEALIYLGLARILIVRPFAKIAHSLGQKMQETPYTAANPDDQAILIDIHNAIHVMSRHTWWESKCLVRAIASMRMLSRRNMSCTLYLGTGKDESGKMIAHAWLRSGTYYVTGAEGMEKFTVVGKFAKTTSTR